MEPRIDKREDLYFGLKVIFSLFVLAMIAVLAVRLGLLEDGAMAAGIVTVAVYVLLVVLFFLVQKVFLIGHLKGNGVAVSERQFPEAYELYRSMGEELGLDRLPRLFILQEGGFLNAFAVRFSGSDYIAIYSEVFSLFTSDPEAVKFILGHELGHVKRRHMSKRFWTCLSSVIPFLTPAYSRACEYTCDNFGLRFAPEKPMSGLLLLAAGKDLYPRIDLASYLEDAQANRTGAVKFTGLFVGHPYLPNRIRNLQEGGRP